MQPVSLVTIHHEGAGAPSNDPRGAGGGYCDWIGADNDTHLRSPWVAFATLNFNHVSYDICLSGNRMDFAVTDLDIVQIALACARARARGELVDHPFVRFHHDSPGSSTVCPGTHAYERQATIVAACQRVDVPVPVPAPAPKPIAKEAPVLIPSPTQAVPSRFDGVKVDIATQTIANRGAGVCAPNPAAIGNKLWDGVYVVDGGTQPDGFRHFVVVTTDGDEYEFHVK